MDRTEALSRLKDFFETVAEPGESICLLNADNRVVAASRPADVGRYVSEAGRVYNRQRRRIVAADRNGLMRDIRPLTCRDEVFGVYIVVAGASRLSRLETLVDGYVKNNIGPEDIKERSVVRLDLEKDIPYVEEKPPKNKRQTAGKRSKKRLAATEAPPPVREYAYLLINESHSLFEAPLLEKLAPFFPGFQPSVEPTYLLVYSQQPVDLSIRPILVAQRLKLFCSYGYEPHRKKAAVKALHALLYTPDPIEEERVVFFASNRTQAMIILSYLDHPDFYLDEIAKLRLLERNKSLYTTFSEFLVTDCSVKKTCERLAVHRNTVCYRLKKIEQLLGCPIVDNSFSYQLFSLYVLSNSFKKTLLPDVTRCSDANLGAFYL